MITGIPDHNELMETATGRLTLAWEIVADAAKNSQEVGLLSDEIEEQKGLLVFCSLTRSVRATKTAFYNSAQRPQVGGYTLVRFDTNPRANWHYECAKALLDGDLQSP
jgi:hypothetical protein